MAAQSWDPEPSGIEPGAFRHALASLAAGVVVVTARRDGAPHAMTATAFCSVSLDPPLVLVSVSRTSRFHATVLAAGRWAVSVLRDDQVEVARHFSRPGRDLATQFDAVPHAPAPVSGAPVITGALVWLDCRTEAVHEAGDHTVVVGRVLATGSDDLDGSGRPLTYYRSRYRT
ncbi:flavin reductase (DIM6/NTAB) family NADH-FMN oxidoreductase RutF [Friedmanniella endophytica]|uniref:Flavin reductase (DIM6/NTAB) family NADH-FMN oxidoreductase RutF n=1 Tax=Microlunatus kandeliicorticis TaxID=1759536 RepID=A0A7W3P5Z2_9ACTN|nr:flavin reductase family protein [Microlunatus kandeliicorticis]MBA8794506.1 flavin reductase (DIM6/NTAB) family NADH-FMN oxidoreductase RutF [Microlunatus kandeliicorticis]